MKTSLLALAAVFGLSTMALAQTVTDTDGDGAFSMEELKVTYPDLTAEMFITIDTDGDELVSAEELDAAVEAGVLAS